MVRHLSTGSSGDSAHGLQAFLHTVHCLDGQSPPGSPGSAPAEAVVSYFDSLFPAAAADRQMLLLSLLSCALVWGKENGVWVERGLPKKGCEPTRDWCEARAGERSRVGG